MTKRLRGPYGCDRSVVCWTPGRQKPTQWISILLLASICGCFEDRIEERLVIGLFVDQLDLFYEVSYHERHGHGDRAAERVADHERSLLDGSNSWLRALASVPGPLRSGSEAFFDEDREDGPPELERFTAWARSRADDGAALRHVFGHTPVSATLTREPHLVALDLTTGASLGGTRRQRLRMERELEDWSRGVATYTDRVADVWRFIEANPHRQQAIYEALFSDLLDPSPEPALSPAETDLLDRLDQAEGAVAEMFETADDDAHSLQELSRLIYDPYPLEVVVALLDSQGRISALGPSLVEGLEPTDDGGWRVQRTSLWDAYLGLRDRWVTPNPLAIEVEALRRVDPRSDEPPTFEGFDLAALLHELPSVRHRPTALEVADEVRALLAPPEIVRIAWAP